MFMFVVRFCLDSCYNPQSTECRSNPMFQSQVVDFINVLNDRGHTLIGVDRVWTKLTADFDEDGEEEEMIIIDEEED